MIITSILSFLVAVGVLVVFHEFGHYWVARLCGVKVLRFSVGFGNVLYARRFGKGETEWVLSAIPLGGYVKMLDEREGEVAPHELSRTFNRKPVWQRMAIVSAGPFFNLLLAVILYAGLFMHGVPGSKPVIGEVQPGSAAALAQFQSQETILAVDGHAVPSWEEFRWKLLSPALQRGEVEITTRTADGVVRQRSLDLSGMVPADMKRDFLLKLGLSQYWPHYHPVIGSVMPGMAAEQAGVRTGDTLLRVDGKELTGWEQWVEVVSAHPGKVLHLDIQRDGRELALEITPRLVHREGQDIGFVGLGQRYDRKLFDEVMVEVSYSPVGAVWQGIGKTWDIAEISLRMLGKMVLGEVSFRNLSGPVKTAEYAGQSAELGLMPFIFFIAFISVGVGVLNILPVPVLDGGHLMYYMAEFLLGRPVSERAWEVGQRIGVALLASLMVLVLYNDISSYF